MDYMTVHAIEGPFQSYVNISYIFLDFPVSFLGSDLTSNITLCIPPIDIPPCSFFSRT